MPDSADPLIPKYQRVVLKLSGEGFGPQGGKNGISIDETLNIARQIQRVHQRGAQLAVVIGGGNLLRGAQFSAGGSIIKEATAHYMGMLATVLNGLALQDALESINCATRLLTAIRMESVAEPFIRRRAIRHLEKDRAVIFAAGTGNPFFTTDTAAALRANEIHADILLKATKVDGLYTADPETDPQAVLLPEVTYQEVLEKDLKVMDTAAIALCRDNGLPISVFEMMTPGNIRGVVCGERIGSIVRE